MKSMSKLTVARLILSGAIVGVALGNLLGVQLPPDLMASLGITAPGEVLSGAVGATVAAVAFKVAHIL